MEQSHKNITMRIINITKIRKGDKITSRNFGSVLSSIASCLPSLKVNIQWINCLTYAPSKQIIKKLAQLLEGYPTTPSAIIAS